jgi:hypothetical protein
MVRSITIAGVAAAVLAGGALTATAANSHGSAVSKLATTTTLTGQARGEAISTLARSNGDTTADAAKADATTDKATAKTETDTDADTATDNDAHGDAVSAVAMSDATAAHANGQKKVNHGGAVSAIAQKH